MDILRIGEKELPLLAPLAADFRAALNALRGEAKRPDDAEAEEELLGFLKAGWPVFAAAENGEYAGYIVCKIEEPTLWVEQIFVSEAYRRRGAASLLFSKAEELAASMGEETVFRACSHYPKRAGFEGFFRQTRRVPTGILSYFKGTQRRMTEKDPKSSL